MISMQELHKNWINISLRRKSFQLLYRNLSSNSNPNPNFPLNNFLFSHSISTPNQLLQFFSLSITSHLLQQFNLYIFNSLINSLSKNSNRSLSFSLLSLIHKYNIKPDCYTLTTTLKSISHLKQGEQIHSLSLKLGFESNTFVINSLIKMYSQFGLVSLSKRVFDTAPNGTLDVISWNSMISSYFDNEMYEESLIIFAKMVQKSIEMNEVTPINALISCGKLGLAQIGKNIHGLIVTNGFNMNCYLGSSLINMYAKCGIINDAQKVFDEMPERNSACWGALIGGYNYSRKFNKSIELFKQMENENIKPHDSTIASLISSCAQMGALNQGNYIHSYCDINNLGKSIFVKNALIDMYSKCGEIQKAYEIFLNLNTRDVFSWTSIISGLAMNGFCTGALHLFEEMERECKVVPNEVTFLGVLLACSHGGLVQKGYFYFGRMCKLYNIKPRIEHYGCMVDLLGRAKLINEAYEFIKNMPISPDIVIWRALIFACRSSGEIKIANYAIEKITELNNNNNWNNNKCGGYVLLSNVYASSSMWGDVKRIRGFMRDQSVNKVPGCSFIEINGVMHEFFAGDISHREADSIYAVLSDLMNCCYSGDLRGVFA